MHCQTQQNENLQFMRSGIAVDCYICLHIGLHSECKNDYAIRVFLPLLLQILASCIFRWFRSSHHLEFACGTTTRKKIAPLTHDVIADSIYSNWITILFRFFLSIIQFKSFILDHDKYCGLITFELRTFSLSKFLFVLTEQFFLAFNCYCFCNAMFNVTRNNFGHLNFAEPFGSVAWKCPLFI